MHKFIGNLEDMSLMITLMTLTGNAKLHSIQLQ